jgi:hypothetical protein
MKEVGPACRSERCKTNGPMHTGKQNHPGKKGGRSRRGLMALFVARFAALPAHLPGLPVVAPREVSSRRLEVEADERGSLVAQKANKPWGWMAMEQQTRHSIAFHVGDRGPGSAPQ